MQIGKRLKEVREQCGLSQQDVAERLNVTRQSVSRWETDKSYPDLANLTLLGEMYHMSMDDLLGIKEAELISDSPDEDPTEENVSERKERQDWKELGILYLILIVSCLIPPLGIVVPIGILWKYRKEKIWILLKVLCIICVLISVYNCVLILNSWFHFLGHANVQIKIKEQKLSSCLLLKWF